VKLNDNSLLDGDLNDIQIDRRLTGNKKGVTAKKAATPCVYWCRDQDLNQGHTDFQSRAFVIFVV